jgi:IMP dehydrogenase
MVEIRDALSYDDVLLTPGPSDLLPRDVDLSTTLASGVTLGMPLLSAAMDKVTEAPMAVAVARQGGLGVIHKNSSIEVQASMVERVKRSESGFISGPITLAPDDRVERAFELMARYKVSGFPVVDTSGRLVGLCTNRDLRIGAEAGSPVSDYMTTARLVTAPRGTTLDQARDLMQEHRVEKLPIVDEDLLVGMFTFKDVEKVRRYPNSAKDAKGRLLVAAAVGMNGEERAEALVEAGVDLLAIDSAHGHSRLILEFAGKLKDRFPDTPIMVGNVATAEAVRACADHGADVVKIGIGPGSICTTRIVTGVGMPQFTAVADCSEVARELGIGSVADGGIKYSGDAVKALAAGATAFMVGNMLAGTDESPGELVLSGGRRYKEYRGMGSIDAMRAGSADRYFQGGDENTTKLVPEGVSGLLPYRGSVGEVVGQLEGGLRSGMGYVGAGNLAELFTRAKFVKQTAAGARESHVHDLEVVHEAPNYQLPGRD